MNIGIFGGSFNPIHKGHVLLAQGILQAKLVEEIWFVVSPRNPLKQESELMDDHERLRLVSHALRHIDGAKACDVEFHMPRPSYTYLTLEHLSKTHPLHTFTLVIGADNWTHFDQWRNHKEILSRHPIIIYPRPGYTIDTQALPPTVKYVDMPLYNISSTQIRDLMAKGEDVSALTPE